MQTNKLFKILRPLICFTVLSWPSTQAQAQALIIDSLKAVLPTLKDTGRIKCMNRLAVAYMLQNPDSSRFYSKMAIEKVYFNKEILNSKPIYFICATEDKAISYAMQKKMIEANGNVKKVFSLNMSHIMPFVQVTEVVEILNGL